MEIHGRSDLYSRSANKLHMYIANNITYTNYVISTQQAILLIGNWNYVPREGIMIE